MRTEGPPLETLTRRLAATPPDFLAEPRIGGRGAVFVPAVVNDLLADHGAEVAAGRVRALGATGSPDDRNRLSLSLLLCWLLRDPTFHAAAPGADVLLRLLDAEARELAAAVPASRYVEDPERREELVRIALARCGLRPAGESEAQAEDRLTSLSSRERERVLRAAREAEERARQIREALRRKAAEESADKWTRE